MYRARGIDSNKIIWIIFMLYRVYIYKQHNGIPIHKKQTSAFLLRLVRPVFLDDFHDKGYFERGCYKAGVL